jgi:hypothetical protein
MDTAKPLLTKSEAAASLLARPVVRAKLLFLVASFLSLVLSVSLWFSGNEQQGIFVGLWVPSILSAGSLLLGGRSDTE